MVVFIQIPGYSLFQSIAAFISIFLAFKLVLYA